MKVQTGKSKIQIRKSTPKKKVPEEIVPEEIVPKKRVYFGGKQGINGAKPGEVRNPYGRPPTAKCIPDILRRIGDDPIPEVFLNQLKFINPKIRIEPKNNNMRFGMLLRTYYDAIRGDKDARHFIAERTEGKVTEKGLGEGKGEILEAIDRILDTPLIEAKEEMAPLDSSSPSDKEK
jgi:hypothetical protein